MNTNAPAFNASAKAWTPGAPAQQTTIGMNSDAPTFNPNAAQFSMPA